MENANTLKFLANRRDERRSRVDMTIRDDQYITYVMSFSYCSVTPINKEKIHDQFVTYVMGFSFCYANPFDMICPTQGNYNPFHHYNQIGHTLGMDYNIYHLIYDRRRKIILNRLRKSKRAILKIAKAYLKRKQLKLVDDTLGRAYNMPREISNMIVEYL